jgi:hypothetical protein
MHSTRELRANKRTKLTENVNSRQDNTEQNSTTAVPIDKISDVTQDSTKGQNQCIRTAMHPLHVISPSRPPDKQLLQDIPKGMTKIYQENLKQGLPKSLIVLKDEKGRERLLVPRCQRVRHSMKRCCT